MLSSVFSGHCIPSAAAAVPGPLGVPAAGREKLSLPNTVHGAYGVKCGHASRPRLRMGAS